jgi:hypothetical protein
VRLASPIGSAAGGSVNLSTSLSNVAKLAADPKFMWVFNANCDGTIIYNDPVPLFCCRHFDKKSEKVRQVFHKIDNNQNFLFVSARY